jgi:hypothetical protein
LSEIKFDALGRPIATTEHYEYQFFKQMHSRPPSRNFMNALHANSAELKDKTVRVFGRYTTTAFKRSSDVSAREVRDGY